MDIKFTNILNQRQYSFHSFISLNTLRGRRFYNNYIIDILCLSKITDQKTTKYLKCRLLCETSWLNRTNYENVQTHEGESAHKNSNPSCFKLNLLSENTRWVFFFPPSFPGARKAERFESLFTAARSQIDLLMLTFIQLPWVTVSCDLTPSYRHCWLVASSSVHLCASLNHLVIYSLISP